MLDFEVVRFSSFRNIQENHIVTAAADIDDNIKRKRIRISSGIWGGVPVAKKFIAIWAPNFARNRKQEAHESVGPGKTPRP